MRPLGLKNKKTCNKTSKESDVTGRIRAKYSGGGGGVFRVAFFCRGGRVLTVSFARSVGPSKPSPFPVVASAMF